MMEIKLIDSEKREMLKAVTKGCVDTCKLKRIFDMWASESKAIPNNPFLPDDYNIKLPLLSKDDIQEVIDINKLNCKIIDCDEKKL